MTAGNPRVIIVDCGSSKVPIIAAMLEDLGAVSQVVSPSQLAAIVSNPPQAVIISGNPALIRDTGTKFLSDFEVLRTLTLPILGICFGHQVLGMLYDATVTIGKEDRDLRRMEILQTDPLFTGLSSEDEFQEDHTEEITLPQDFIHVATSSHCCNEAMMHPELPIYGVQFHPECSGSAGKGLLANFLSLTEEKESR